MQVARHNLNQRQTEFVRHFVAGSSPDDAAAAAGYGSYGAGRAVLRSAAVVAAVDQELRQLLAAEAAPLALSFLMEVVTNHAGKYGERVRVDAAKTLLDRAGYQAPKHQEAPGSAKDPHQMGTAELHDLVMKLEGELASRAKVIEPVACQTDSQLADLIE
jgi:hypothetical protein